MNSPYIIKHRVNQISQLAQHDPQLGIEIDLRSLVGERGKIHLSHDAWTQGDDFEVWLDLFSKKKVQGPLILNTKEDGLEERCFDLLAQREITNFFFLDTTIPTLVRLGKSSSSSFSVRFSRFENLELCFGLKEQAAWVWVDCFDRVPVDVNSLQKLRDHGFKVCLVSPELQGGNQDDLARFKHLLFYADAICTKSNDILKLML
jgi:hypothetical protein